MKNRDVDRVLATHFEQTAPPREPEWLVDRVLDVTREIEPAPRWIAHWRIPRQTSFRGAMSSFAGPVAAAIAVVVLVAGAGLLLLRGQLGGDVGGSNGTTAPVTSPPPSSPASTTRPTPFNPAGLPEVGTILGGADAEPGDIVRAAAHGAVWAGNQRTGEIVQFAPETGDVVRRVAVHDGASLRGNLALAADNVSIWARSGPNGSGELAQIDPATGTVMQRVRIGVGAYDIAIDGSTAWVTDFEAGAVVQVDLAAGEVTWRNGLTAPTGVVVHAGEVWVVSYETGLLYRLDRADGNVIDRIAVGVNHMLMESDGDYVWFGGNQAARLTRVDVAARGVTTADASRFEPTWDVAVGDGRIWASIGNGSLAEFDRETLEPVRWTSDLGADHVLHVNGTLWVGNDGGDVSRVEPAP